MGHFNLICLAISLHDIVYYHGIMIITLIIIIFIITLL